MYISIHSPLTMGDFFVRFKRLQNKVISIHSPLTRGDPASAPSVLRFDNFNPLPSHEGRHSSIVLGRFSHLFQSTPLSRGETGNRKAATVDNLFQSTPLSRGETLSNLQTFRVHLISIHSPLTRGDSISLQKSIRIYVSLHNKTMIHRFSGLYKPLFAAQSPIFGVRSPRKSHDSFTFARPSDGPGITP